MDLEAINFDSPTEVRTFEKGRFELYRVGPMTPGRATYEPGWRSSEHVGPATGESSCKVEHVGLVLSGEAVARMDAGREVVMRAGDFFYVPPGHDSWGWVTNPMSRYTSSAARSTWPRDRCHAA
jgi:Cupin domain